MNEIPPDKVTDPKQRAALSKTYELEVDKPRIHLIEEVCEFFRFNPISFITYFNKNGFLTDRQINLINNVYKVVGSYRRANKRFELEGHRRELISSIRDLTYILWPPKENSKGSLNTLKQTIYFLLQGQLISFKYFNAANRSIGFIPKNLRSEFSKGLDNLRATYIQFYQDEKQRFGDIDDESRFQKEKEISKLQIKNKARNLFSDYENCLEARTREDLQRFIDGKDSIIFGGLSKIEERIQELKAHKIPEVFRRELETPYTFSSNNREYHRFPTLDYLINLFSQHPIPTSVKGQFTYLGISSVYDIIDFARYACRPDDFICDHILIELKHRIGELGDLKSCADESPVIEDCDRVYESAAKILSKNKFKEPDLKSYNPQEDLTLAIVRKPFWYAYYDKDSILKILDDYTKQLLEAAIKKRTVRLGADRRFNSLSMMENVFPEIVKYVYTSLHTKMQKVDNYIEKPLHQVCEAIGWIPHRQTLAAIKELIDRDLYEITEGLVPPQESREEYKERKVQELLDSKERVGSVTGTGTSNEARYFAAMKNIFPNIEEEIEDALYAKVAELIKEIPGYKSMGPGQIRQKLGWKSKQVIGETCERYCLCRIIRPY